MTGSLVISLPFLEVALHVGPGAAPSREPNPHSISDGDHATGERRNNI